MRSSIEKLSPYFACSVLRLDFYAELQPTPKYEALGRFVNAPPM